MKSELKTKATDASVKTFLEQIDDQGRKQDCLEIIEVMRVVTGEEPRLWGSPWSASAATTTATRVAMRGAPS